MPGKIASIGECMVELAPNGQGDYRRGFAGDTYNTAFTLGALLSPGDIRYVTATGDDRLSRDFLGALSATGLDASSVRIIPDRTMGLYMITLDGAERSFTYWRSVSAARLLADDPAFLDDALAGVSLAYFSGITLAILTETGRSNLFAALASFRKRGGKVAFDPNIRMRLWTDAESARRVIAAGYRLADIALPSFDDEATLFGDRNPQATIDRISALGAAEIVVKDGEASAEVFKAGERHSVASIPARPIDTTGAGDSFNAGYLAARHAGRSPEAAAHLGHLIASRVIAIRGALIEPAALADIRKSLMR